MIRTIEEKKYKQLEMIAQIAAQQLFYNDDLIALVKAVIDGKDGKEELVPILENAPGFTHNNQILVQLLIAVNILKPISEVIKPELEPEVEKPVEVKKPTFTIIK